MTRSGLIWLSAAWQFVFMVDFIAPLPLGATLSRALGFAAQDVAWLSVSYTLASLLAGLIASRLVAPLGRQRTIWIGMGLFTLANVITPWADALPSLLACRALAGLAGAPVTATLMSLVIDATPPAQRGKAISSVMSGASLAVVAGVPLALSISNTFGWPSAFRMVAAGAMALMAGAAAWQLMALRARGLKQTDASTSMSTVEATATPNTSAPSLLRLPSVRQACGLQALSQFATFLLIPVLSTYLVGNLGITLAQLPWLYAIGGLSAMACMRLAGHATDRWGHAGPLRWACIILVAAMATLAWQPPSGLHGTVITALAFVAFMAANAAKNVSLATYTAGLAPAQHRAAFMNLQGSMQDLGILAAGLGPVLMLSSSPDTGRMAGMGMLVALASGLLLLLAFAPHGARARRLPYVSHGRRGTG